MQLQDYFKYASQQLKDAGYLNFSFEARALITQLLKISNERFISSYTDMLTSHDTHRLETALKRRCNREPLAKIVGQKEFWGLSFKVSRHTLDPRPDSETLVEAVLNRFKEQKRPLEILELGTGSGCLILSLLYELKNARGLAIDICDKALNIAMENAKLLNLSERCQFNKSNWFENVNGRFDIIVSNPPYIPENQLHDLGDELNYDPKHALTAGPTGLESYELIIRAMGNHMKPGSKAFFEIGFDQAEPVSKIVEKHGCSVSEIHKDLAGRPRVIEFNREE